MDFKDLENVERGTILVDDSGDEYYFNSFSRSGQFLIVDNKHCGFVSYWIESNISGWSIKRPEPKKLGEVVWFLHAKDGDIYPTMIDGGEYAHRVKSDHYIEVITNEKGEIFEVEK